MLIESKILRPNGTIVTMPNGDGTDSVYTFAGPIDGPHVAEVEVPEHIERLLAIVDGFRIARAKPTPEEIQASLEDARRRAAAEEEQRKEAEARILAEEANEQSRREAAESEARGMLAARLSAQHAATAAAGRPSALPIGPEAAPEPAPAPAQMVAPEPEPEMSMADLRAAYKLATGKNASPAQSRERLETLIREANAAKVP